MCYGESVDNFLKHLNLKKKQGLAQWSKMCAKNSEKSKNKSQNISKIPPKIHLELKKVPINFKISAKKKNTLAPYLRLYFPTIFCLKVNWKALPKHMYPRLKENFDD